MNKPLEELIAQVKEASISVLMDSGELGGDRIGAELIALSLALAHIPVADVCIMLALHYGVMGAEIDEAVRKGARSIIPMTFEEHLRLFCEYARVAYRDRTAAGFMEDAANVPTPDRAM